MPSSRKSAKKKAPGYQSDGSSGDDGYAPMMSDSQLQSMMKQISKRKASSSGTEKRRFQKKIQDAIAKDKLKLVDLHRRQSKEIMGVLVPLVQQQAGQVKELQEMVAHKDESIGALIEACEDLQLRLLGAYKEVDKLAAMQSSFNDGLTKTIRTAVTRQQASTAMRLESSMAQVASDAKTQAAQQRRLRTKQMVMMMKVLSA